jgi:hypothetical protein
MSRDSRPDLPRDFLLVERDDGAQHAGLIGIRNALRSTWAVPTDTFVTANIPLLLTRLSVPDRGDR